MDDNLHDAANSEAVGIAILVVVLAVSPVIIWLVRNAVATIQVNICQSLLIPFNPLLSYTLRIWQRKPRN